MLSAPQSRIHVALAKLAAIATAIGLIGGLIGLMAFAGGVAFDVRIPLKRAWLFAANITLLAGVFAGLALLASQFTTARRTAAGVAGILLGLSMLLTSAGRTVRTKVHRSSRGIAAVESMFAHLRRSAARPWPSRWTGRACTCRSGSG